MRNGQIRSRTLTSHTCKMADPVLEDDDDEFVSVHSSDEEDEDVCEEAHRLAAEEAARVPRRPRRPRDSE